MKENRSVQQLYIVFLMEKRSVGRSNCLSWQGYLEAGIDMKKTKQKPLDGILGLSLPNLSGTETFIKIKRPPDVKVLILTLHYEKRENFRLHFFGLFPHS